MVQNNTIPFSPGDVARSIFRHKGKSLGFFVLVMASVTLFTVFCPRSYESVGKLLVRTGRENAMLDPTATLGREPQVTIPFPETRQNEIHTLVELLQTRPVLEHVAETLGPARILDTKEVAGDAANSGTRTKSQEAETATMTASLGNWIEQLSPNPAPPRSEREKAIDAISKRLHVAAVRKSSVINISFKSRNPKLSQDVVSAVIRFSIGQHARLNRTKGSNAFFAEQKSRMRAELKDKQNALRDLRNRTGPVSLDGQREVIVKRMARLEDELSDTLSAITANRAKIEVLNEKLAAASETEVSEARTGIGNEGTDDIRVKFYALQLQEQEAAAKMTDAHPELQTLRERVTKAREVLEQQPSARTHVFKAPGKIFQATKLALLEEQPLLAWHEAKRDSLKAELLVACGQWKALNEHDLQVAEQQREVELCETNYLRYAETLEQTRIDQALQWEQISNINVLQPATYDVKPIRPRKLATLVLGLMVASCGGLALALVADFRDRPIITPDEVEANLEPPTLVSIPRFKRRELRPNGRK